MDGKATPVRLFDFKQPVYPGSWQMAPAGALQVLVFEGAAAKRYRIRPGSETIDTALAGVK